MYERKLPVFFVERELHHTFVTRLTRGLPAGFCPVCFVSAAARTIKVQVDGAKVAVGTRFRVSVPEPAVPLLIRVRDASQF